MSFLNITKKFILNSAMEKFIIERLIYAVNIITLERNNYQKIIDKNINTNYNDKSKKESVNVPNIATLQYLIFITEQLLDFEDLIKSKNKEEYSKRFIQIFGINEIFESSIQYNFEQAFIKNG